MPTPPFPDSGDWVLVPREPTEAMSAAGLSADLDCGSPDDVYRAMLSATPTQASDGVDELCRKMWPDAACWSAEWDGFIPKHPDAALSKGVEQTRDGFRKQMRAFLSSASPVKKS